MKAKFFVYTIALLLACSGFAQKPFEGVITYTLSFDGLPAQAQGMMGNSSMKIFLKDGNSRTELSMLMMENTVIYDGKAKTSSVLMNMMGKKFFIKQQAEAAKQPVDSTKATITYADETKQIAGYTCKKAFIKSGETAVVTTVWYTEEIPNSLSNDKSMQGLQGLKGIPMEFEMKQAEQGFTMKMAATKVSKEAVEDAKFTVPSDYKETTQEELLKNIMGNMEQK